MVRSHHRRGWGLCTAVIGNALWQKIHVLRLVMLVRRQFNRCLSISNTTLGPSGHGMKPPSSRLGTLYSHWRQWFITKIHVLRLVSFVQRQSKHCVLIWNITLGPSCHGTKPPSSRLGTLYSRYRQCFMTKNPRIEASDACPTSIQASFVDFKHHTGPQWPWYEVPIVEARDLEQQLKAIVYDKNSCFEASCICWPQLKRCLSISNTTLGPSGHGMKPQLWRLGTLYSHWRK